MAKKNQKTTEELTEEFFAFESAEYEKRVPEKAFPRIAVRAPEDIAVPLDLPAEGPELIEEKPLEKIK